MIFVKSFETIRKKLFQRDHMFTYFKNITEEDIRRIDSEIEKYIKRKNFSKNDIKKESNLENYVGVLTYLTSPNIHLLLKTYDEKILFLIKYIDPNLIINNTFLQTQITPIEEIDKSETIEEQNYWIHKRHLELKTLENIIREKLDFYEPLLIRYELAYYNRFKKNKELTKNIKIDLLKELIYPNVITSFNNISDEDYQRLINKAEIWLSNNEEKDYKTVIFNILKQNEILKLKNIEEKIAFFILTIDPDLKLLTIFEEESRMPNVITRSKEELGFYNETLIKLEKVYQSRFLPDKKISIWSK